MAPLAQPVKRPDCVRSLFLFDSGRSSGAPEVDARKTCLKFFIFYEKLWARWTWSQQKSEIPASSRIPDGSIVENRVNFRFIFQFLPKEPHFLKTGSGHPDISGAPIRRRAGENPPQLSEPFAFPGSFLPSGSSLPAFPGFPLKKKHC